MRLVVIYLTHRRILTYRRRPDQRQMPRRDGRRRLEQRCRGYLSTHFDIRGTHGDIPGKEHIPLIAGCAPAMRAYVAGNINRHARTSTMFTLREYLPTITAVEKVIADELELKRLVGRFFGPFFDAGRVARAGTLVVEHDVVHGFEAGVNVVVATNVIGFELRPAHDVVREEAMVNGECQRADCWSRRPRCNRGR